MEKKRKKKAGVDLSKTLTSPSAPPPPAAPSSSSRSLSEAVTEANAEALLAKLDAPPVEAIAAAPPPIEPEAKTETPAPVEVEAEAKTETPAPVEAHVEAEAEAKTETPPPVQVEAAATSVAGPVSKKKKKKKSGDRASTMPATAREPAVERASKRKVAASAPIPKAKLDEKLDKLEQKLEEKKVEAEKAARAGFASSPDIDDISVPPVDLDEHDDRFFEAGEKVRHSSGLSGSFDAVDPAHARKMTAEAKARRAHLTRYVKGAVIAAAAILALALVVSKLRTKNEPAPAVQVTHAPDPTPPPPIPSPTQVQDTPPPPLDMDTENTVPPDPSASTAASVDTSPSAVPSASASVEKPAKTALQEKLDSKALLEREAYGAAVAAGERSVALDSTDGEAWLILGAAYQGMGNAGQAKRCYTTCTKQKRGPIADCQQMLQQ